MLELVVNAGLTVQVVLITLVAASVACWAIIVAKWTVFRKGARQDFAFLSYFWKSKSLEEVFAKTDEYQDSPVARVFKSGFKELQKLPLNDRPADAEPLIDNIQRALGRATHANVASMEKHLGWLATTASAAPFVGLFGTVWGIMNAFQDIGASGAASLAVVAPGISEALVATAVGLGAAIPAVVSYNHFVNMIKRSAVDMECFVQDFLNIVQRGFLTGNRKK